MGSAHQPEIGQASNEELLAAGRPLPDVSSDKPTKAGTCARLKYIAILYTYRI